jgi:two-component system response regulator DevR
MRRRADRMHRPLAASAARPPDAASPPIRVFVLDDDSHARRGIRMRLRLEADIEVLGEPGSCAAAIEAAAAAQPDVIVIDLQCEGVDGVAAARRLFERTPGTAIVMLSIHDDERLRATAASAGVSAFVAKYDADCALIDAIRSVARRAT